ncbi:molybdenum cofactor biosynthesis protein A [bacterium BMS3Abin09]|nr:molybdenum cofactor biosynthesis protein A [bacterium BMS3Abin09]GBE41439.1 molybdenum cofactor biosynthesis protein A [bacterium BMS3Bbin09]
MLQTLRRYNTAWNFFNHLSDESLFGGGLDITNRCNLRCTHCYWWRQKKNPDLDDKQMIEFMKSLRRKGLKIIYLLGGEPLLRPNICAEAGKIFDFIMIFTNGTLGYPPVNNALYSLSIDGPERVHDKLRGKGIFKKVTDILDNQSTKVMIHITVCKSNHDHLEETIEQFVHRKNVRGIYFCFYCPSVKPGDENIEKISLEERDGVVDELVGYRKKYGNKIFFTERVGYYLKTDGGVEQWNSLNKCVTKKLFEFYAADGQYKYHCAYGAEAECKNCGCSQVPLMHAMKDRDFETCLMTYRDYWAMPYYDNFLFNAFAKYKIEKSG